MCPYRQFLFRFKPIHDYILEYDIQYMIYLNVFKCDPIDRENECASLRIAQLRMTG